MLELDLVEVLDKYPNATKTEFLGYCQKIAKFKWGLGQDRTRRPLNAYQLFVKTTMKTVAEKNPQMAPKDRMRVIGELWRQKNEDTQAVTITEAT